MFQNNLAYFPFMHCPLVATCKTRWPITYLHLNFDTWLTPGSKAVIFLSEIILQEWDYKCFISKNKKRTYGQVEMVWMAFMKWYISNNNLISLMARWLSNGGKFKCPWIKNDSLPFKHHFLLKISINDDVDPYEVDSIHMHFGKCQSG